jgi:hypothetical protein
MQRVFRFFGKALGALVILGIPALLVYLQFVGFGEEWRARVAAALGGTSFQVEIGRLTFHPFEGIVAEGITLHRKVEPDRQLAEIDRLIISPNLADLLRGRVTIDRLSLDNASANIPFADDGIRPDVIQLRDIGADIWNTNGQITISRAECRVENIHVTLHGHLLMPTGGGPSKPSTPEHRASRAASLRGVLEILRKFEFAEPRPELDIAVSGDLSRPDSLGGDAITLRTGGVRYGNLSFDRVMLDATYADHLLHVKNLRAFGSSGALQVGGTWNFAAGNGRVDLSGGLSLAPLLELAGRKDLAEEIRFERPPAVDATVTASSGANGPSISAVGQVSVEGFRLRGIRGRGFSTRFAWKDGRIYLQDTVLKSRTGTVRAQVLSGPGELRLTLDSDADPTEFLELFGPKEQDIIKLLDFKDPPKLTIALTGTRPSLDAMSGSGHVSLGRSAMRDSWVDSGEADIEIADRAIVYKNLTIHKGPLKATGSFTYDFGRHEVRLNGIRSNLNPPDILMWVDPRIAATVAVYRFRGAPDVRADGIAHMVDPRKNDLDIRVDAPEGLAYTLLNRDLLFDDVEATVLLKGQQVIADVERASLYGGDAAVKAKVSIAPEDPSFSADVSLDRVDFPSLTKLYFGYSKSAGVMSGKYAFDASLRDPSKMRGRGSIRVEEGHVLAIPLFGPISVIISKIIPGAGHENARLATANFTISDQVITTRDLDIQGSGFELFGDGTIGFPGGRMDLTVRINARGIPGLVFFPVSKLMEYVSVGTVSDPQWRPKVIPREFFDVLGLGGNPPPTPASASTPAKASAAPPSAGKSR